jgi:hypothetical protein
VAIDFQSEGQPSDSASDDVSIGDGQTANEYGRMLRCVIQNDDYAGNCGAGYPARGPAFQRVQPPRKAAAGKIACPTA